MLEPLVRGNLPRLQNFYDRCPAPARHLLTSMRGWLLTQIRYSPQMFSILQNLRASESWTPAQISFYQLLALRRTVDRAARTTPFYFDYPRCELASLEDLRVLPVLDRETVLQNHDGLLSRSVPAHRRIVAATTGTTGAALRVAYTEEFVRNNWAFLLRQWAWACVAPRHPRITLQGPRVVPAGRRDPPFWTFNVPERQILLSIFHLSERTAASYLDLLRKHPGAVLEGFPSVLTILAEFARERGLRLPMRVVFTSGEPLYASARAGIEEAFRARVFDTYGMTEYCGLIQECEFGRMHLAPEYGFLEILNSRGEPVGPGEEGDFVWTGFLNDAMPLIRYRIGDSGRWDQGECACGRAFPLVVPAITRESDLLRCPDGRVFSPRALNQLLKESNSLRFCQFVHERPSRVAVRAVARSSDQADSLATQEIMGVRAKLQTLLGESMQVTAYLARAPIARGGGKIPLIVNEVAPG
ncbi:MAG TPA: AMP-binding protein [Verrucomicrobiae bacterium]|nr:AMP-binding protein [Verrucomicrobiae bacterium]